MPIAILLTACLILVVAGAGRAADSAEGQPASGPVVVRVYYDDLRDIARLGAYDVWEYNNIKERYVLAAVNSAGYASLVAGGWRVRIDDEATAMLQPPAGRRAVFEDGYRTVDELYAGLTAANSANPTLTEIVAYGQSHCLTLGGCLLPGGDELGGYPLQAIRVTNEAIAGSSVITGDNVIRGSKPIFFLMANIHAREITTPEIAMRYLDLLIDGYGLNADITWLVDWHEIWIVPTVNPDGHRVVEMGAQAEEDGKPYFQRKNVNLDVDADGTADCPVWPPLEGGPQFGIDLNRNHSFGWGGEGSSDEPCSLVYHGPAAASESEVVHLETLVRALFADQRGPALTDPAPDDTTGLLITLHSYSNLVLWPWGHLYFDAPNKPDLKAIGDKFASYNGYYSCQPTAWDCLYAAAGATDDWAYGELGIPAYTFEIGNAFMPPYEAIDSTQWPQNRPALLYAARIARTPYQTVRGPDVIGLAVEAAETGLRLSAVATDEDNGGDSIAAAAYTIDVPPWQEGALPNAIAAVDAFNGPVVAVGSPVDTTGLLPGRHTLYVQAQDTAGNWGPVSAAFFTIDATPVEFLFVPSVLGR